MDGKAVFSAAGGPAQEVPVATPVSKLTADGGDSPRADGGGSKSVDDSTLPVASKPTDPAWKKFCAGYEKRLAPIVDRLMLITTWSNFVVGRDAEIARLIKEWEDLDERMTLALKVREMRGLPT